MKKIVLTGGPCGGKTVMMDSLKMVFTEAIFVTEAATTLLHEHFPVPKPDSPLIDRWQVLFEQAIFHDQVAVEDAHELLADPKAELMISDRGLLDVDAYAPGCSAELLRQHGMSYEMVLARYGLVIHLTSLAKLNPKEYGKQGNEHRFEDIERALVLEERCREAWARHPNRIIIDEFDWEEKTRQTIALVRAFLAS